MSHVAHGCRDAISCFGTQLCSQPLSSSQAAQILFRDSGVSVVLQLLPRQKASLLWPNMAFSVSHNRMYSLNCIVHLHLSARLTEPSARGPGGGRVQGIWRGLSGGFPAGRLPWTGAVNWSLSSRSGTLAPAAHTGERCDWNRPG